MKEVKLIDKGMPKEKYNRNAINDIKNISVDTSGKVIMDTLPEILRSEFSNDVYENVRIQKEVPMIGQNGLPIKNSDGTIKMVLSPIIEKRMIHKKGDPGQNLEKTVAMLVTSVAQLNIIIEGLQTEITELKNKYFK